MLAPQNQAPQYAPNYNNPYQQPTYDKPQQAPSYHQPLPQNPDSIRPAKTRPVQAPLSKKPKGKVIVEEVVYDDESDSSPSEEGITPNNTPAVEAPVQKVCFTRLI